MGLEYFISVYNGKGECFQIMKWIIKRWLSGDIFMSIGCSGIRASGVYVVYGDGLPIYVGQSKNVSRRLMQHAERFFLDFDSGRFHTKWGDFDSVDVRFRQLPLSALDNFEDRTYRILCALRRIRPRPYPGLIGKVMRRGVGSSSAGVPLLEAMRNPQLKYEFAARKTELGNNRGYAELWQEIYADVPKYFTPPRNEEVAEFRMGR
jgi:hypothetical protein